MAVMIETDDKPVDDGEMKKIIHEWFKAMLEDSAINQIMENREHEAWKNHATDVIHVSKTLMDFCGIKASDLNLENFDTLKQRVQDASPGSASPAMPQTPK